MAIQTRDFKFDLDWVFRILHRFWPVIAATTLAGLIGAVIYLQTVTPKYSSSLKFLAWNETVAKAVRHIQPEQNDAMHELQDMTEENRTPLSAENAKEMSRSILMYNDLINRSMVVGLALIRDYQQLIEDSKIAHTVRERLAQQGITGNYHISASTNTTQRSAILTIHAVAADPKLAQAAAEMTMEVFKEEQQRLMGVRFAQKISDATLPDAPFFPNRNRTLLLGILLGMLFGCMIGALLDYLDYSIKSPEDLTSLGLLPLGNVPEIRNMDEILSSTDWYDLHKNHLLQENLALLKINLHHRNIDNPQRTILITSDTPGCGKSTNAILLAQTLAATENSNVLLIDCDLRKPSIFMKLNQSSKNGLVDCLLDFSPDMNLEKYLSHSIWSNMDVMTHGQTPQRPSDFFESKRFAELLKLLKSRYRYIILDAPPVTGIADSLLLSRLVDAVILIVSCGKTRMDSLSHLFKAWPDFSSKILGAILNRYSPDKSRYGYYGGYYGKYYGKYYGHDTRETNAAATPKES